MADPVDANDKQTYAQLVEAELNQWQAQIDHIMARISRADAEVTIDFNDRMNELKLAAQRKFERMRSASHDSWRDFREDMEAARKELTAALEAASDRLGRRG